MATTEQLTEALRTLLADGVRGGVLTQTEADRRLRAAGVEVATPARTVTITAQVNGNVDAATGYGRDTINRQVELALVGAARAAGLTVVGGSTRVNF